MDRGVWQATVHRVRKGSETTEQLTKHSTLNLLSPLGCGLLKREERPHVTICCVSWDAPGFIGDGLLNSKGIKESFYPGRYVQSY